MSEKVDKGKDQISQDQREDDSLSRRDFIKRGAVVGAGAGLAHMDTIDMIVI